MGGTFGVGALAQVDLVGFRLLNQGVGGSACDAFFAVLDWANFGLAVVLTIAAALAWRRAGVRRVLLAALFAFLASDTGGSLLKQVVRRPRPCRVLADVRLLAACPETYAFPSNHAANAAAVAAVLAAHSVRLGAPAFLAAGVIAYSRVFIGVHYPSDVLGGIVYGTLVGALAAMATRRRR